MIILFNLAMLVAWISLAVIGYKFDYSFLIFIAGAIFVVQIFYSFLVNASWD